MNKLLALICLIFISCSDSTAPNDKNGGPTTGDGTYINGSWIAVGHYIEDTMYLDITAIGDSVFGIARTEGGRFPHSYKPYDGRFSGRIIHSLSSREIGLIPDTMSTQGLIWIAIKEIDSINGTLFGLHYGYKLEGKKLN